MAEAKCNRCEGPIIWIELEEGWRPFDYGMKESSGCNPLINRNGTMVTSGKGFVSHFTTCDQRIRDTMAKARKDKREREERRKKRLNNG